MNDEKIFSSSDSTDTKVRKALAAGKEVIIQYEESTDEECVLYSYSDWIQDFCQTEGMDWLAIPSDDFLRNDFNFNGLDKKVNYFKTCLKILRNEEEPSLLYDCELDDEVQKLFFLIHQRYVQTSEGMKKIFEKYQEGLFGQCPRSSCHGQKVIPYGSSAEYGVNVMMVYCPCCRDAYYSYDWIASQFDGSAFGPSFAHLFEMEFFDKLEIKELENCKLTCEGFKLSEKKRRLDRLSGL